MEGVQGRTGEFSAGKLLCAEFSDQFLISANTKSEPISRLNFGHRLGFSFPFSVLSLQFRLSLH